MSGKSDSTPLNYKARSMGFDLNEACIFTDKDISLVTTSENLVSSLRFVISGGSFDVSLIESYTNAVIHLKSNCKLWGIDLNTAVLGKLNSINDGVGLYFDATVSTGYLSYIRTNCIVKYFGTGIKVKGTETQRPSWVTDFVDRSETNSCRQSLYVEYCEEAFIEGHYQQTYLFETEENDVAAVYLKIRIAAYIVIIAGFVTIVDLVLQAFLPALSESLGVFIPLIVVNCIVLGRAEAFASKNGVAASALDGLCQGFGYTVALIIMCVIREFLGNGTFGGGLLNGGEGIRILPEGVPAMQMVMPVGGFLAMGVILAGFQYLMKKMEVAKKDKEAAK